MSTNGVALRDLPNKVVVTGPDTINVLSGGAPGIQGPPGPAGSGTGSAIRKNSAGTVFSRGKLNLIEGANVTITIADDAGNDEIDLTIASTGGGGDPAMGGDIAGTASAAQLNAGVVGATELAVLQSSGVGVVPVTIKNFAGQDAADAGLLEFKDSANVVWLRIKAPLTDPLPATASNPGAIGRIDFPYTGTGLPPVGVTAGQVLFASTPDPIVALHYNYQVGTGLIDANKHSAAIVIEGQFNDGTITWAEMYMQYFWPGVGFYRPVFTNMNLAGTNRETRVGDLLLEGNKIKFNSSRGFGNTLKNFLEVFPGSFEFLPVTGLDNTLRMTAPSTRNSYINLYANGSSNSFIIGTSGSTQVYLYFSTASEAFRIWSLATTGFCVSIGYSVTDSMLTVANLTTDAAKPVITAQGMAAQTGALFRVRNNIPTTLWSIDSGGIPCWDAAGNQQATVGTAGAAAALPATPTKYLKVKDSAGTTLVVPAYAAV